MQVNLPKDTVERCRGLMFSKEPWGCFIERILNENEKLKKAINEKVNQK